MDSIAPLRCGRRTPFLWVWLAVAALLCGGCDRPKEPLRVGANLWPGYEPLYLIQREKLVPPGDLHVLQLASAEQVISALRNHVVDVAAVTADEALQVAARLEGVRIVLVCDFSNGADAIIAQPGIASMAALKGRRVGVEPNALGAFVLAQALESAGLAAADITVVPVSLPGHEAAFRQGQVDAIVTFDPARSRLLAAGGRSVFDSSQIPGEIVDVLLARPEVLVERREQLQKLVTAWFLATSRLHSREPAALAAAAAHQLLTPEELSRSLDLIRFPDLEVNRQLLGTSPTGLRRTLQELDAELAKHGLTDRRTSTETLVEPWFVERVVRP